MARVLKDVNGDIDNHLRSHVHLTNCIHLKNQMHKKSPISNLGEEAETSIRGYNRGLDRGKRRKFRSTRGTQISKAPRDEAVQSEKVVEPTTIAHNFGGRSFGSFSQGEELVESNSSIQCDEEGMSLLVGVSGSQRKTSSAEWENDFSGELGLYADNLLNREIDFDKVSEARTGGQHSVRRHQSLTKKYTPKSFKDIVGQNLVTQALSNSVSKRKVGLAYVLYGPHGTGKTSAARVFARALNCQSVRQTKPCGFCNFCKAYDKGKTRNIKELGSVSNFDFEGIMDLLETMMGSQFPSQYRVFIFDDCDTMSTKSWSALSKVMERAPGRVVFILICSSLNVLPHVIISKCQKFLFPNLKDADIIHALRSIATKEVLDIDDNALKIIASRSDGSLRDAEMTLEQLSLLGPRITISLVQELVGLTSDEKLVDLLDLALSDDTVNTVKSLREIMESGVEPLALMSQLATLITDILAGTYDLTKERSRRKFFQRGALSREHMEKLREALKTLSEAEKQLRMSSDRSTWLIAAILKLAADQQYNLPNVSAATNLNGAPVLQADRNNRERTSKSVQKQGSTSLSTDINRISERRLSDIVYKDLDQIWSEVLEKIPVRRIKEFMFKEAKLISLSFDKVPTVQLMFSSQSTKSKAKSYGTHLLRAFESVLGSPLRIEIRCESSEFASQEIVEAEAEAEAEANNIKYKDKETQNEVRDPEITVVRDDDSLCKKSTMTSIPEGSTNLGEPSRKMSLVKTRMTLAQVIRQKSDRSNRGAVSIAEELEYENLRLEPRTRSFLCCKAPRRRHRKHSHSKIRNRKAIVLMRYVSCGKCLSKTSR